MAADPLLQRAGERWDERLAVARSLPRGSGNDEGLQWLARWRQAVDSDDAGLFAQRLAHAGLSPDQAASMLAQDSQMSQPPWWDEWESLQAACRVAAGPTDPAAWLGQIDTEIPDRYRRVPFAHALWPMVVRTADRLDAQCPEATVLAGAARDDLRGQLLRRLSQYAAAPLGELFAAAGKKAPRAASGVDRYAGFCVATCRNGFGQVLDDFPVLARLLATATATWTRVTGEALTRLDADCGLLAETYGCSLPLQVLGVRTNAGDVHRRGRSVMVLQLAGCDGSVKVVYKPKDMRIEQRFQQLAAWFVRGAAQPAVKVLERYGRYGYASFVEHRPCAAAELPDFYRNAGRLLALLYLLGATDGHAENFIAAGRELVLIDQETLFEVSGVLAGQTRGGDLHQSVLRIGMLPQWERPQAAGEVIDISALGVSHVRAPATRVAGWVDVNTDAMHWGWVPAGLPITIGSLPVAPGTANPLRAHLEALVAGFASGYRLAMEPVARARLTSDIEGFRGVRRRIVIRPTRVYAVLAARAAAARCLRSANARGIELDRLCRSALVGDKPELRWALCAAEVADLENLDIPYFDYPLGSRDIHCTGSVVPEALPADGLEQAQVRVERADETDLAWQTELIRASVHLRELRTGPGRTSQPAGAAVTPRPGVRQESLQFILDMLADASLRDPRGRLTWLTLRPTRDGSRLHMGKIDLGWYSGRAGMLSFLDAVVRSALPGPLREQATELIGAVWAPVRESLAGDSEYDAFRAVRDCGLGLNGAGGLLSMLVGGLSGVSSEQTDSARARIIAALDAGLVERDRQLDFVSGAAGAVQPLIDVLQAGRDPLAERVLGKVAEHLRAQQDPRSGGWPTEYADQPLTGFSHGAGGIGLALLRAGVALRSEEFVAAGARGLAYEHSVRDDELGNWPDLRRESGAGAFMVAWCHGAPGIALARLRALQVAGDHPDSPTWREDLRIAAATTAAAPLVGLDHICCGNLGRSHVLSEVGAWLRDPALTARAVEITEDVLAHWQQTGEFRLNELGPGSRAAYPSTMTGLPGIGLHLLDPTGSLLTMLS